MQCISWPNAEMSKMPKNRSSQGKRLAVPLPSVIRMHADLEPNQKHPLANLPEKSRNERRQHVFGMILARLAAGPSSSKSTAVSQPNSLAVAPSISESSLIKQETGQ